MYAVWASCIRLYTPDLAAQKSHIQSLVLVQFVIGASDPCGTNRSIVLTNQVRSSLQTFNNCRSGVWIAFSISSMLPTYILFLENSNVFICTYSLRLAVRFQTFHRKSRRHLQCNLGEGYLPTL